MTTKSTIGVAVLAMTVFACTAMATTARVTGKIERILVADEGRFGGCMVLMDKELAPEGLNCESDWVTFSCSGTLTTPDEAARLYDLAKMAFALHRTVSIEVNDNKKIGKNCYGQRVDLVRRSSRDDDDCDYYDDDYYDDDSDDDYDDDDCDDDDDDDCDDDDYDDDDCDDD